MHTATEKVPVGGASPFLRAEQFRQRMIEAHRLAFASRKRPLIGRHRLAEMFRESPRYVIGDSQRAAIDSLFQAEADDDLIRAIGHQYDNYIEARIAERNARQCVRQAFRKVVKETGEATEAQLIAEQEPTPANRLRAEKEVREAKHAYRAYLNALWHDALDYAAGACRRIAQSGERVWR